MRADAIVEARPRQSVAVRDFDRVHTGLIKGPSDLGRLLDGVLVTDGMHAVPQGDVLNVEFRFVVHAGAPCDTSRSESRSPVARAAEVMMSRLPA